MVYLYENTHKSLNSAAGQNFNDSLTFFGPVRPPDQFDFEPPVIEYDYCIIFVGVLHPLSPYYFLATVCQLPEFIYVML